MAETTEVAAAQPETRAGVDEAFVDGAILTAFGVPRDPSHPEYTIDGLTYAIVWTFRRGTARGTTPEMGSRRPP